MTSVDIALGNPRVRLIGFEPGIVPDLREALTTIVDALWPDRIFPPLKSEVISVENTNQSHPLYVQNDPSERIILSEVGNALRFAYQLAHEMGHLAARADTRFYKTGWHAWVEEVVCGACSVHVIRRLSQREGLLKAGALDYLSEYINVSYSPLGADPQWYAENEAELKASKTTTPKLQKLAGLVADTFPGGEFVFDNRALLDTPLNPDFDVYAADWASRCRQPSNVPALLQGLARDR